MCRPLPSVLRARLDPILLAQDQNLRILDFPLVSLAQEEPQADERSDDDDEGDDGVEGGPLLFSIARWRGSGDPHLTSVCIILHIIPICQALGTYPLTPSIDVLYRMRTLIFSHVVK